MAFDFKKAAFAAKKATGKYNPAEDKDEEGGAPAFGGKTAFAGKPDFKKPEAKPEDNDGDKKEDEDEDEEGEEKIIDQLVEKFDMFEKTFEEMKDLIGKLDHNK